MTVALREEVVGVEGADVDTQNLDRIGDGRDAEQIDHIVGSRAGDEIVDDLGAIAVGEHEEIVAAASAILDHLPDKNALHVDLP